MALEIDKSSKALISKPSSLPNWCMTSGTALNLLELQFSCLSYVGNTVEPTHRIVARNA